MNTCKFYLLWIFLNTIIQNVSSSNIDHKEHFLERAINASDTAKAIQIGDTVANTIWHFPLKIVSANQEFNKSFTLDHYRDKFIILDFWATWCGPCVSAFPKMDSLKKEFKNDLVIISITNQKRGEVTSFLKEMNDQASIQVSSVVEDSVLSKYFAHRILPHYVWIDKDGVIQAVTGLESINSGTIRKMIAEGESPNFIKYDGSRRYDYSVSLKDQVGEKSLVKSSTFTSYTKGFSRRYSVDKKNANITLLNASISWLYRIAYSEFKPDLLNPNRFVIDVRDSMKVSARGLKGEALEKWSLDNSYCYELKMNPSDTAKLFEQMRLDINAFFPYEAKMEKREMLCLVLSKESENVSLATKGGDPVLKHNAYSFQIQNLLWKNFTSLLDMYYLQNTSMPFVDETGIFGKVDLHISTQMTNYTKLAKALEKYGLILKIEKRSVPMIVLRDKGPNS